VGRIVGPAVYAWSRDWVDLYQFLNSPALREIPFRKEEAQKIVTGVINHTLPADRSGRVKLPPSLASASKDGGVYVTRKRNGQILILFPTWQGKGGNVRGYLFCSRPLTKTEENGDALELTYLARLSPEPEGVMLQRKVSANWYYVSYGLD
jgi:hypothetical protein